MGLFPLTNSLMSPSRYSTLHNDAFVLSKGSLFQPQSYTITNVTLNVGPGYAVEFVNPSNYSDVYAISSRFEVKAAGSELFCGWVVSVAYVIFPLFSPLAPPASTNPTGGSSSSGPGSPSSSSSSSKPSETTGTDSTKNGALSPSSNILFNLATCGLVAVASFFA